MFVLVMGVNDDRERKVELVIEEARRLAKRELSTWWSFFFGLYGGLDPRHVDELIALADRDPAILNEARMRLRANRYARTNLRASRLLRRAELRVLRERAA